MSMRTVQTPAGVLVLDTGIAQVKPRDSLWCWQSAHGKRETFGVTNQTVYYQNSVPLDEIEQAQVYIGSFVPATGIIASFVSPAQYDATNRYVPKDAAGANLTPQLLQFSDQPCGIRSAASGSGDIQSAVNGTYSTQKEEGWLISDILQVVPRRRTDGVTRRGAHFQFRLHGPTTVPCVSAVDAAGGSNATGAFADFNPSAFKLLELEEDSYGGYAGGNQTLTTGTWSGAHGNGYQAAGVMVGVAGRGRRARSVLFSEDSLGAGYLGAELDQRANLDGYGRRAVRILRNVGYLVAFISDASTTTRATVYCKRSDIKISRGLCTDWVLKPISVNDLNATGTLDSPSQPALTLPEIVAQLNRCTFLIAEALRKGIRVYLVREPFASTLQEYNDWFAGMASAGIPILDMGWLYQADGALRPEYRAANYPVDSTHTNSRGIDEKASRLASMLLAA